MGVAELTMQNAVHHHYPNSQAEYRFTNRARGMRFSRRSVRVFRGLVGGESGVGRVGMTWFLEEMVDLSLPTLLDNFLF